MADPGFDPNFLSVPAPLPAPGVVVRELPFTHFTVLLRPDRRLAVVTGVNLDGAELLDLERGDDWHVEPRVPVDEQVGPELYADNDLDRGHLVRRRDPVWGEPEVAAQANLDTFSYVNAAPQAALSNQGETLWLGLEDYVLTQADTYDQRLSVFTAPVLASHDPVYHGVQLPRGSERSPPGRRPVGTRPSGSLPPPATCSTRARCWIRCCSRRSSRRRWAPT